jgi:hypothetical protein
MGDRHTVGKSVARDRATCWTPDNGRQTKEREMREAFMSFQDGIAAYQRT